MLRTTLLCSLLAASILPACATDGEPGDELADESDADGEAGKGDSAAAFTFFSVSPDLRACAPSNTCGGMFVSRVNRKTTNCGRGTSDRRCFVKRIDWSGTAMPDSITKAYEDGLFAGPSPLLKGEIVLDAADVPTLAVTEIWPARSENGVADGVFVLARDNGIRCVTTPCNSINEIRLNSSRVAGISGVDLEPSGADAENLDRGYEKLHTREGVIVVGYRSSSTGGKVRNANQFYTRAPVPLF